MTTFEYNAEWIRRDLEVGKYNKAKLKFIQNNLINAGLLSITYIDVHQNSDLFAGNAPFPDNYWYLSIELFKDNIDHMEHLYDENFPELNEDIIVTFISNALKNMKLKPDILYFTDEFATDYHQVKQYICVDKIESTGVKLFFQEKEMYQ